MRQLDLFGSLFDISFVEQKQEERETVFKKSEKEISTVSITQEVSYSLVEIAEERALKVINEPDEMLAVEVSGKEHAEPPEQKIEISSSVNTISKQSFSVIVPAEKLYLNTDAPAPVNIFNNNCEEQIELSIPKPERNGTVIFDDGKITVKVKNKHIVPDTGFTEKEREEEKEKEKEKKEPQKRGRKSLQEIEAEADLIEVPDDQVLFQKQYYSISEVAKWFRVNTSLLRFWENEFEILKPKKNRKGDRLFRPEDVKNLQLIYHLLRHRKYTIEGAKDYLKTNKKKADMQMQLTNSLQRFKSFLLELKADL